MYNFMPYYGHQHLEFACKSPIVLINGENMWGKTSILNAFKWCWYGTAYDRFKNLIPRAKLINWDAIEEGNYSLKVDVMFRVDEDEFSLTRKIQPKSENIIPQKDSDFEELVFLTKNDRSVKTTEIQQLLNSLMPYQVLKFFFFDGENLNSYEELLLDPDTQSSLIQESIEDILGLPAMANAIKDLGVNYKDAAKRQRALAAKDMTAKSHVDMAERTEAAIENAESDLRELTDQRGNLIKESQTLDKALRDVAGIEIDVQRLSDIEQNIKQMTSEITKLDVGKKDLLASSWTDLVAPIITSRIEDLRNEQSKNISNMQKLGELKSRLKQIDDLLTLQSCPLCKQKYPDSLVRSASQDKIELTSEIENLKVDQDRLGYLSDSIRKLSRVKPAGVVGALSRVEDEIRRKSVALVGLETRRDDLKRKLENHDQTSIAENRARYNQLMKRIGAIESDIKAKQSSLERLNSEAEEYRKKISQACGPELDRLNHEVSLFQSGLGVFDGALERLRKQLKVDIERDATESFLQLTTDRSYKKLKINESYGLSIIRENNREVPLRSAGAEQIVALSLISALNINAVRRGPIIMDTVFGRLDPTHRGNVLRYMSHMAHQVMFLVHSGEIDKEKDIPYVPHLIDAEYFIERVSGTRSTLRKISGV
jgi:DNA sulfur modification protein DndD